jgi:hypothetical protein
MTLSEAEIIAKISTLEIELARAEQQVAFGDRNVTYKRTSETKDALNYFRELLGNVRTGRSKQTFGVATSKGF